MPTFTVTYASDMNEGTIVSSSDDLKGAEPPILGGLEFSSETTEASLNLKDAGPPALPGAAAVETAQGADLGDAGPPPITAMAPTDDPDLSGPPPIDSLK